MSVLDYLQDVLGSSGNFIRNQQYAAPGVSPRTGFNTDLGGGEAAFRKWLSDNRVPFNPDGGRMQDYDMRGFYRGLMNGDPHAQTGMNTNDGQLHYSDYWKTPYHQSFSAESQWANPAAAPRWNEQDQLVTPEGRTVFDERAQQGDSLSLTDVLKRYGIIHR